MKHETKRAQTLLLNLKCRDTKKVIEVEEIVKIHDWGMKTSDNVIGYGHFAWDEGERNFYFVPNELLNNHFGIEWNGSPDDYDLFRTTPAKLNYEEQHIF